MRGKSQKLFKDGNEFVGKLSDWKLEFTKAEQSEFPERYVCFPHYISGVLVLCCLVLSCHASPRLVSNRSPCHPPGSDYEKYKHLLKPYLPPKEGEPTFDFALCKKLDELGLAFVVGVSCGPRALQELSYMSRKLLSGAGLHHGMIDFSFLNDGNSENFYDWSVKLYEKVLVAGEVWEQTKMMKHGPVSMTVTPINLELPGGKDVVRGMLQLSNFSANKVAGWSA